MNSIAHSPVAPALSFSFENQQLRVVMIDDEPWFVVADICQLLRLTNPSMAVKALDEDELRLDTVSNSLSFSEGIQASRGNPTMNLTSESGFYTLILRCRDAIKPGTMPHRVRRWVTSEVMPSIRKTGGYSVKRMVPRDRQIGSAQRLLSCIERSQSKFARDGYLQLAELAFTDLGLTLPEKSGLKPLQMDLVEGGAA
jgi:prophage antirepressor-like protein